MPPPSQSASSTLRKAAAQARSQVQQQNTERVECLSMKLPFPGCSWRDHCGSVHLLSWEGRANALQGEDTHQVSVSEARQGLSSQKGCFQVPYFSGLNLSNLARSLMNFCFRFYFKTEVEGDMCYEEETEDTSLVPLWEGKVLVQCRLLEWEMVTRNTFSMKGKCRMSAVGNTSEKSAACLGIRYLRLEISKCDNRTQQEGFVVLLQRASNVLQWKWKSEYSLWANRNQQCYTHCLPSIPYVLPKLLCSEIYNSTDTWILCNMMQHHWVMSMYTIHCTYEHQASGGNNYPFQMIGFTVNSAVHSHVKDAKTLKSNLENACRLDSSRWKLVSAAQWAGMGILCCNNVVGSNMARVNMYMSMKKVTAWQKHNNQSNKQILSK